MPKNAYPEERTLQNDEIRLVLLLAGDWKDDIECKVVHTTLARAPTYHALSYVWGSPKILRKISLDSKDFFTTANLESALRHLRSQLGEVLLWVDAICINQANILERTHQVGMMGRIFQSSQSVLVFLSDGVGRDGRYARSKLGQTNPSTFTFLNPGLGTSGIKTSVQRVSDDFIEAPKQEAMGKRMQDTLKVFSFIQSLSSIDHLYQMPLFKTQTNDQDPNEKTVRLFENLRQLMHAPITPWWGRMWVLQEVVLPPEITLICGTVSAPWTMFARAASRCARHIDHCCSRHIGHFPRDLLNVLKDFCHRVLDIDNLRSARWQNKISGISRGLASLASQRTGDRREQTSLVSLLRRFRGRKASDARDKVYALLSLVEPAPGRPPMIPDYSLSESDVYIKAALESIYDSSSLSVLSIDVARKYRQDLPSWVPDWEAFGDPSFNLRIDMMELYDTCADYRVDPSTFQLYGSALISEGKLVDVVHDIGEVMLSDSAETFRKSIENWVAKIPLFISSSTIWRALCADVIRYPQTMDTGEAIRRAREDDELMFMTWMVLSTRCPDNISLLSRWSHSEKVWTWCEIINFEKSIQNGDKREAGQAFQSLLRDVATRTKAITTAYTIASAMGEIDVQKMPLQELLQYATLTVEQYAASISATHVETNSDRMHSLGSSIQEQMISIRRIEGFKQKQLRVWDKIPWATVLYVVRPQLQERLGSAAKLWEMSLQDQVSIIDRSIASATKSRRLFFTIGGFMGFGPANTAVGDCLYLIKGGRTPFLLRQDDKYVRKHSVYGFEVIGDCYASGLMDSGKLEENLKKANSRWSGWEPIHLI